MSLAKLPLRIAAVRALRGATFAADAVFDSAIAPLSDTISKGAGLPLIVVYSDDAVADPLARLASNDLSGFHPTVTLTFHAAIATAITVTDAGQTIELADSDAAYEALLDILEAQILAALQKGAGVWADLWRAFAISAGALHSRRGASARKGARFSAREIVLDVHAPANPLGIGPEYPWNLAVETMLADDETDDIGRLLDTVQTLAVGQPDWTNILTNTGLDKARAQALGFVTAAGEEVVFA